mgnify:FL=1
MNSLISMKKWYVYILECSDNTFYTGFTLDLEKRVFEHNNSKTGAKYTSWRRPVKLVYSEIFEDSNKARSRECEIKKLTRPQKLKLIKNYDSNKL